MSKRWDDLPRWLRWTIVGLAALAVVVLAAWVLFVPVADWLARHDVGPVTGPLRALRLQTARDAARGRLLTLGAGVLAAGALIFTASNYRLAQRTHELTEQGQVTDRYTKAIEQLGSKNLDIRIGGIYALERIARDSRRDHPTVMEVLFAFIREHSPEPLPPRPSISRRGASPTRPDVQAAVTVIGRRNTDNDLKGTYVNLRFAFLPYAHLENARLNGADLNSAHLEGAHLEGAHLNGANLTNAWLSGAHLTRKDRTHPADFTDAILTGAHWPADAEAPEGWERYPADSDRLRLVGGKAPESPAS